LDSPESGGAPAGPIAYAGRRLRRSRRACRATQAVTSARDAG